MWPKDRFYEEANIIETIWKWLKKDEKAGSFPAQCQIPLEHRFNMNNATFIYIYIYKNEFKNTRNANP